MKKLLATTALTVTIVIGSLSANALVVSDPSSYTYYVQQIQKAQAVVENGIETINEIQRQTAYISGNLKRGAGIERAIRKVKDSLINATPAIFDIEDGFELKTNVNDLDLSDIEDVRKLLDELYQKGGNPVDDVLTKERRNTYQQKSVKASIESAETVLARQQESLEKFEELAAKIDETEGLKDATDLQNRLLHELILIQQQQLALLAQFIRAEESLKYTGVDSEKGVYMKGDVELTKAELMEAQRKKRIKELEEARRTKIKERGGYVAF